MDEPLPVLFVSHDRHIFVDFYSELFARRLIVILFFSWVCWTAPSAYLLFL